MKKIKVSVIALALILLVGALAGCSKSTVTEGDKKTIKLGINGAETEVWTYIKEELAKEDITLEVISFGDYTRPNLALSEGEIDINSFQHYAFFNKFKEEHNLDLTAIGETVIAPIGLYSSKIKDVKEMKANDKIAIPNDATNGGRTLILLQTAGLIKVDPAIGNLPTLKDIIENPLNLEIIEVDAATTPRMLDDVAASAINSGVAVDAGFTPTIDSIFLEPIDENTKPYINIFAVRTEDKDNPLYKRLIELYQTDKVKEIIDRIYKGSQVTTW